MNVQHGVAELRRKLNLLRDDRFPRVRRMVSRSTSLPARFRASTMPGWMASRLFNPSGDRVKPAPAGFSACDRS